MCACGVARERDHFGDGPAWERRIEVRKKCAAARDLPFQRIAESGAVDGKQDEIVFAAKMFGQRSRQLLACREVDETIAQIVRRAAEHTGALKRSPLAL